MKRTSLLATILLICISSITSGDTFGTGENEFEIEFMAIYGDSNDLGNWPAGSERTFLTDLGMSAAAMKNSTAHMT